jgi:pSer/pThr/pTyr-binding forkhead associated (FHA) protein
MAKITITSGGKTLQEIHINKTISIGREVGDIMIKHPAVSARHAKIEKDGANFVIHDLGSTNGTLVNQQSISNYTLHSGDIITIGKYNMVFENPDESLGGDTFGADDLGGRTMVMDANKIQEVMGGGRKSQEGGSSGGAPALFLAQSSGAPKVMRLSKDVTVIGSSENADVCIKGITVGKVAAEISQSGSDYIITFKGGMAKLKIKGEPVESHTLKHGDSFSIGSFDFEFRTGI